MGSRPQGLRPGLLSAAPSGRNPPTQKTLTGAEGKGRTSCSPAGRLKNTGRIERKWTVNRLLSPRRLCPPAVGAVAIALVLAVAPEGAAQKPDTPKADPAAIK